MIYKQYEVICNIRLIHYARYEVNQSKSVGNTKSLNYEYRSRAQESAWMFFTAAVKVICNLTKSQRYLLP